MLIFFHIKISVEESPTEIFTILMRQNNIQRNTGTCHLDKKCLDNQVRRMVGAAVAAAVGRLDLEASGNIIKIMVVNPDLQGSGTGSVFALFGMRIRIQMLKFLSDFLKRSI